MLKIFQARLQQYGKLDIEGAEEPERKQESSRKTSTSALLTTTKPLIAWITANCGKL